MKYMKMIFVVKEFLKMTKLIDASNFFDEYYHMFKNSISEAELDRLSYMLGKEKKIDPVHFAGGCYCRECFHSEPVEYKDNEGWVTPMDEYWCNEHKDTMPLNGFCSEGRKDYTKNA